MKITDSVKNTSSLSVNPTSAGKASGVSSGAPVTPPVETGSASVSTTSAPLQALQSSISTSGAFDTQKVEAIRQAIAGGQFSVDTSKVANELIRSVRGLLQGNNQQA